MKALIIVDLQRKFFEEGSYKILNAEKSITPINRLLSKFDLVIFTKKIENDDALESNDIHSGIQWENLDKDFYIFKNKKSSAFEGTGLAEFLDSKRVEELFLCGLSLDPDNVNINDSLEKTAIDSSELGFITRIVLDATDVQIKNIKPVIKKFIQYDIKVIDSWELPLFNLI